jgi:hypothetical protein
MKNMQLFSCLLFATIATHCMESDFAKAFILSPAEGAGKPQNPWDAIDCEKIQQALNDDYSHYCKNQLIEYKKTPFTPQHMQHITSMSTMYTGNDHCLRNLYGVKDEEENHFPHIAIQKFDLPVLTWLVQNFMYYPKNKHKKGFLETCIDHLSCNLDAEKKQIAYDMLNAIIQNYGNRLALSIRQPTVEKLIRLQIEHRKHLKIDILDHISITPLLTQQDEKQPIDLSTLYQQVADAEGNTFSHNIVNASDIDELYQLIQNNRVSPAPNKAGKTVVDLALANFQSYVKHLSRFPNESNELDDLFDSVVWGDTPKRSRCCLFMLLNYIQSKRTHTMLVSFSPCCDKHTVKK